MKFRPSIYSCALISLVATAAFSAGCTDETDPVVTPETPPAPVTVSVRASTNAEAAIAGALVAINTEDGALLESGTTDASGQYVTQNLSEKVIITVADPNGPAADVHTQSVYEAKPGSTYVFHSAQPSPDHGTVSFTTSNLPIGADYVSISADKCGTTITGAVSSNFNVTSDCLQSDGKITVYAEAFSATNQIMGYAIAADQTLAAGGTLNLTFNTWVPTDRTIAFSAVNTPGTLTNGNLGFYVYHKNAKYSFRTSNYGMVTGNSYTGASYTYGSPLAVADGGHGYILSFQGGIDTATGPVSAGFISQLPSISTNVVFDLSQSLASTQVTSSIDISNPGQPDLSWSAAEGAFDGAVAILTWDDASMNYHSWTVKAPAERGLVTFPVLPASMAAFTPSTAVPLAAAGIVMVDASAISDYDTFAQSFDLFEALDARFRTTAAGGIKYTLALSSTPVFKPAPGQQSVTAARSSNPLKALLNR
jgi:hypothetical protein